MEDEFSHQYQSFFEESPVSLWEEDFSEVDIYLKDIKAEGVQDFRRYFDDHPDVVEACARRVKVLDINKATLVLYSATNKQELLDNLSKTFTKSAILAFKEELITLVEGRAHFESDLEIKTLAGQSRQIYLRFSLQPKDDNTARTRALISVTDITARKQAEDALKEREEQLRSVLAASPDLIFVLDAEGRYRDIFTSEQDSLVAPSDQLFGKTIHEVMPSHSAGLIQENIDHTLSTGEPQSTTYSLIIEGVEHFFSARLVKFNYQGDDCVLWCARDMTSQRKADLASGKNNSRLVKAEMVSQMGFMELDLESFRLECSTGAYKLFGVEPETPLTVDSLTELLHPVDRISVVARLKLAIKGTTDHELDYRVIQPNGTTVWIHARWDIATDEQDMPSSLMATLIDVTKQKLIEEELRVGHEEVQKQYLELEELYEDLPFGLCLMDRDLKFIRINKVLAEINGPSVDEHMGRTLREVIPELSDQVESNYKKVLETGNPVLDIELTGSTSADPKTVKSWLASYYPIKTADGEVSYLSTVVSDITERKHAEESLRDSEARFRMIYEFAPVMIDAFDAFGRCIMFNKECEKVLGWRAEEVYSHDNAISLFYPDPEIQRQVMESVTNKPEHVFMEWNPQSKDGSELTCLWANFKLPDGLIINIGYDVTEQRKSEEDMHQLRLELLHTTRVLTMGEFTSSMAHELNHPLGSILNNANAAKRILEENRPDLTEIREIISDIISEDRRATQVIQKLRTLMQKAEIDLSLLSVNDVIEEVIELIHSDLVIKNITLTTDLAMNLAWVKGDRVQLQQVFLNLFINGIDAMKDSEEKKLHIYSTRYGENCIIIQIRDSGKGINQKEMDQLFESFYTTKEQGLGMGLPIAKTIVESIQGDIWAELNDQGGASFFVTLPTDVSKQH